MSPISPFEVGQIKAHIQHGMKPAQISRIVFKDDGVSNWTEKRIQEIAANLAEDPHYRGERQEGSGAPRKTTTEQDDMIVDALLEQRGKQKVNVAYLRRTFAWARPLSEQCVRDRLHDAGLKFMRRRRKSIVLKCHLKPRIKYCKRVLQTAPKELRNVAYTDGTTFYLDRNEGDHEHNLRAALGTRRSGKSYM